MKDKVINIRVDKDTLNKLNELCKKEDRSRSSMIRKLINENNQKTQKS